MQIILTHTKHKKIKNKICKTHCKSYSNQTSNDKTQQPGERILEIRKKNISDPAPKFNSKSAHRRPQYTFLCLSDTTDPIWSHWPWRLIFWQYQCIFMLILYDQFCCVYEDWLFQLLAPLGNKKFWAHFTVFYLSSYAMQESILSIHLIQTQKKKKLICWDLYWLIHIHIALWKSSQDPPQIRYCSAPCIVKDCWFICIFLMKSVCSYLRLTIIKCCILSLCSHLCLFFRFQSY